MKRNKLSLALVFAVILSLVAFIIPAASVMAATITATPSSGNVDDTVTVKATSGSGLVAGTYYIEFDGTEVIGDFTVSSTGTFSKTFDAPAKPAGVYDVDVYKTTDTGTPAATDTFEVLPELTLSPTTATVGTTITATGTGFGASQTVTLYLNSTGSDDDITTKTTSSSGSFTKTFTVPDTYRGTNTIIAEDEDGNSEEADLTINPKIAVSATSAAIGDKITVSGTGFTASSAVTITLDGINTNTTGTTNSEGTLTDKQVVIPVVAGGSHTLMVKDASGYSASATVTTTQSINISPKSGPADTDITVTGVGFAPSKSIAITYKGVTIVTNPSTVNTDASGNFSATIKAPKYAAGAYTISVTQGTLTSTATFTQTSTASLDKKTGAVGSTVTASGSGYTAGGKVSVKYDSTEVASATADGNGSFSATFKVPEGPAGQHKITVTDNINPTTLNFTATASVVLGATKGSIGSDIAVSGSGFTPGAAITVKYDSEATLGTADSTGSFSTSIKVPYDSKNGPHTVSVTDGTATTTATFSVETTPPPVPGLVLPANGDKGDAEAKFQWNAVKSSSGSDVTYTLQIAQDSAFASVIVEKTGLTTNTYQLTEQQKLESAGKDKPYYWRVKAIDSASNESNWSAAQTFTVGLIIPGWFWIVIAILGGILLILIGIFVGRKLKGFGVNRE
jgi:hypothetical protein